MGNGWIKLHRELLYNPIKKRPMYAWLWVVLLLKANHKEEKFMHDGGTILIKAGQLLTGREALSRDSGLSPSTVERILNYLENEHQIEQQKTTKYRVITILNWDTYQKEDSKADNKRTADGQPTDTNKNVEKLKNVKKEPASQDDALVPEVINLFKEVNPSYQRLFGMPPQRSAASRLLKQYGLEKLTSMVAYLPKSNASKFAPTITTPSQFEQKLGELIAWSQKQKQLTSKGRGIA